jgi:hypothetical protein
MSWFDSLSTSITKAVSNIDLHSISSELQSATSVAIKAAEGALETIGTSVQSQLKELEKEREVRGSIWKLTT